MPTIAFKKLALLILLCLAAAGARAQTFYAPGTLAPSCSAVTTTGDCTTLQLEGNSLAIGVTWQIGYDTGTAVAISVTAQGSNDNSTWTTLDTNTACLTTGGTGCSRSFSISGAYKYLHCHVTTFTKGTTNSLTCSFSSNPNGVVGAAGITSINADTTAAQLITCNGGTTCSTVAGTTTITGGSSLNFSAGEAPSGTINGSNTAFTLAHTPTAGSVALYLNGLRVTNTQDYTISAGTITMTTAPATGDVLYADYRY